MSIINRMRKQTAVHWPVKGTDSHGKPTYEPPIEVLCRWQDSNEMFINSDGSNQMSNAKVFPDRKTAIGGVLLLGKLTEVHDFDEPKKNDGAFEIMMFRTVPNLKNTENLYIATL